MTLALSQLAQLLQLEDPLAVVEVVPRLQDLLVDLGLAVTPEVIQFPWHRRRRCLRSGYDSIRCNR